MPRSEGSSASGTKTDPGSGACGLTQTIGKPKFRGQNVGVNPKNSNNS